MKLKLSFIRHGAVKSNLERRYIGSTDEALCDEGRLDVAALWRGSDINPDALYSSPMKRCLETTEIIFAGRSYTIVDGFKERGLGDFEGKIYDDLNHNKIYIRFIESGGTCDIPGGEGGEEFSNRCNSALDFVVKDMATRKLASSAIVCHGGVIMSIFSRLGGSIFDYLVDNGHGFIAEYDTDNRSLVILERI